MSTLIHYFKTLFVRKEKAPVEHPSPEDELIRRLKPYERHLYKVQDIIAWKDVSLSIATIVFVNFVFWFISYFEWRFFGFFFSILSTVLIHDAWVNHIWPEIRVKDSEGVKEEVETELPHEGVLTLPELSRYATEFQSIVAKQYGRLKHLRTTQPVMFCILSSSTWIFIAGLGSFLLGMAFLYILTLAVLTVPGIYIHIVTPEQKQIILRILHSAYFILFPPESSKNVDEYMPDNSKENLDILAKAGDNSNDLSTPSSDSSMVDLIPGHDESSVDTLDSFHLPLIEKAEGSETDSEADALSFKNTHFNGNSSGEDEPSLVRNLSFPDIDAGRNPTLGIAGALTGVFYKTFPNISGRLQFRATGEAVVPPPAEESDSEFEIIDEDS
uniref:Unkown protein n=1 Tax=Riptortus pedestris TaxID=329032 RepID=R4WRQ7_RIPPE|nr:unkown protein [Riptortus pedestris]